MKSIFSGVRSPLFADIAEQDLTALLACLSAVKRSYRKGEFIFRAGEKPVTVGLVLTGSARVVQEDFWGHRLILAHVFSGDIFGEAFSCAEEKVLPVGVTAAEDSEILLIDYRKIVTTCSSACLFHARLVMNMLRILAEKNMQLTRKIEHLSKRTTREKLLSYLSDQAVHATGQHVEIPFNRQELADYLCVDRSALSRELGQMQSEGLVEYDKNSFTLTRAKGARDTA